MSDVEEPDRPKRGRPRDPGIRKRVLPAAAAQFNDRGYEALTMDGIVAESGVAKRTLYRWWPSKAAVVADAVLGGFIDVPRNDVASSGDVWADLRAWLERVSLAMQGPYGEVLRASTAIGATDAALGAQLGEAFLAPAYAQVHARLSEAVRAGQVTSSVDVDAAIDVLMATIVYVGSTRQDSSKVSAILEVLRSGIAVRD